MNFVKFDIFANWTDLLLFATWEMGSMNFVMFNIFANWTDLLLFPNLEMGSVNFVTFDIFANWSDLLLFATWVLLLENGLHGALVRLLFST